MQSWIIDKTKSISLQQREQQEVNLKTHARVKIARASLCQSDIAIYQGKLGKLPIIPSRNALGMISESRQPSLQKGLRVYLSSFNKTGENTYEILGRDNDGYLSDFCVANNDNIYIVPESIKDEAFTFIEDISMAIKTCSLISLNKTNYIALFGATSFNIIMGQLALYYQAIPIIIDTDESALEIAEQHGIYYALNSSKENITERIIEITAGNMVDKLVVDCDIFPHVDSNILSNVAKNGDVAFVGYDTSIDKLNLDSHYIISKRLSIFGVNDGYEEIEAAINFLATEVVDVEDLLEKMYDFSEVPEAFSALSQKRHRFKNIVRC